MFHFISARIWKVAALSAIAGAVPLPGFSFNVDTALLTKELRFYNSQLGIPDENSPEFENMTPQNKKLLKIYFITSEVTRLFTAWAVSNTLEESVRFIPWFGAALASSHSFTTTYKALSQYLDTLRDAALEFIKEQKKKIEEDFNKSFLQDIGETEETHGIYAYNVNAYL